jgi:hypothetical protein
MGSTPTSHFFFADRVIRTFEVMTPLQLARGATWRSELDGGFRIGKPGRSGDWLVSSDDDGV